MIIPINTIKIINNRTILHYIICFAREVYPIMTPLYPHPAVSDDLTNDPDYPHILMIFSFFLHHYPNDSPIIFIFIPSFSIQWLGGSDPELGVSIFPIFIYIPF